MVGESGKKSGGADERRTKVGLVVIVGLETEAWCKVSALWKGHELVIGSATARF